MEKELVALHDRRKDDSEGEDDKPGSGAGGEALEGVEAGRVKRGIFEG